MMVHSETGSAARMEDAVGSLLSVKADSCRVSVPIDVGRLWDFERP